jgi:hypothetical protein
VVDLPDPVPLGVSGLVTLPRKLFETAVASRDGPVEVLSNDEARIVYLAARLEEALDRPLIIPGSAALARSVLGRVPEPAALLLAFAQKALETLRDDSKHDRMFVSTEGTPFAVWFVSWSGTHMEALPVRHGTYLDAFVGGANRIVERVGPLAGFLEIDAFVRESVDPQDPGRPLSETFEIEVEFSYLPGHVLRYPQDAQNPLPNALLLNRSLCSAEERQLIERMR